MNEPSSPTPAPDATTEHPQRLNIDDQPVAVDTGATQVQQRAGAAALHIDETTVHELTVPLDGTPVLQRLGDYRVVREIGRGGMGVVYEAEQESLCRRVALKVLLGGTIVDPRHKGRFEREARAAARLHHTNIVPVFGVGESADMHYYVMQFIQGRGLDGVLNDLRWLARNRRAVDLRAARAPRPAPTAGGDTSALGVAHALLAGQSTLHQLAQAQVVDLSDTATPSAETLAAYEPIAERSGSHGDRQYWNAVARLGAQVADALAYAHEQGILHRDIKPANLLLDGKGTVWVADFGLAKAMEQDNLTQTGDVVGTLRYMAPESFRGQNDARTDIYALGLTLYELVSLRPAFDAHDRNRLVRQVTSAEIPPLRRVCPAVPQDLETIVLKALERDPDHRYRTAAEMAADLQRFLQDEPIHARRATLPQRLARWYRHNPVVARLTAALILVFLAGFAGVTWKWREAERQKLEIAAARNDAVAQREQAMEAKEDAKRQATIAETINNFLVDDMLAAAAPELARGHQVTVEEVLRQVGPKIEKALGDEPEVEASVRNTIGTTMYRLGLYDDAEPHLRRALELRETVLGPDAPDTLAALNNLAETIKAQGKLAEAEPLYRRSLAARERTLGANDPETLGALNNLAQALQAEGKLAEAEPLYERSLAGHRRELGDDDPNTLLAQGALALCWQQQGKFAEAEPLLRKTYKRLAKSLGADHPLTLTAGHNLAGLLQAVGRRDEAQKLYAEVLATQQKVLGTEHPDTLLTMNQMATLLQDSGKLAEAEVVVRQLLEATRRVFGDDHPQTFVAQHNLSRLLQSEGKLAEAEPLARSTLAACRRVLGDQHPDTLQATSGLAMVLQAEGKFAEAAPLLRQVLETQRRVLGPNHPHTLVSLNNLAVNLQALGKLDEAEPLVRENVEICRRELGPDHPDTLLAMSTMTQLYMSAGKWAEADAVAHDSYDAHVRVLGPDHPETLNAADDLVTLLLAMRRLDEAEPLVKKLVAGRERVVGPNHPDTLKSLATLALVLESEGKPESAEPLLREALDRRRKTAPDDPETQATERSLAIVLAEQKKWPEAEKVLRELLAELQAAQPPVPMAVSDVQVLLGEALLAQNHPADAEPLLREAVEADRRLLAEGHLRTAQAESAWGEALVALKRYDEAEPLLVGSFAVLSVKRGGQREARRALERVIALYEAWDKPSAAAEWQAKLPASKTAVQRAAAK
ncbi:MAG TPA: tetratricopeptide repeat protein [Pirellulales bacterium]|nr:tetratricopeptide repeat protein [Pirellulales bacterium]